MEEQMSLFDMGGLADDGSMRDPVSGNEVPPGSMASEVRDDVPAMLSEGEYIVPADVVRYYGVKFFEDLRSQAKSGLTDMEQDGRIGGEPIDATPGDEPLTPEELAMLTEISGMAKGGMVRQGYQVGGVVAPVTQQDFLSQASQAEQFRMPTSVFSTNPATTTQTSSAAIWVTVFGTTRQLRRNSSSARYKTNIVDADEVVLEAARKVKPRHYESTIEDENGATRLGFIAEEIHEAGLTHAVGYDADGKPETIDPVALIAALWHRVSDLEDRLKALEEA
jgi:hypothetical protein